MHEKNKLARIFKNRVLALTVIALSLAAYSLTGDTRKIFVSNTVDESHSARVLIVIRCMTRRAAGAAPPVS